MSIGYSSSLKEDWYPPGLFYCQGISWRSTSKLSFSLNSSGQRSNPRFSEPSDFLIVSSKVKIFKVTVEFVCFFSMWFVFTERLAHLNVRLSVVLPESHDTKSESHATTHATRSARIRWLYGGYYLGVPLRPHVSRLIPNQLRSHFSNEIIPQQISMFCCIISCLLFVANNMNRISKMEND